MDLPILRRLVAPSRVGLEAGKFKPAHIDFLTYLIRHARVALCRPPNAKLVLLMFE